MGRQRGVVLVGAIGVEGNQWRVAFSPWYTCTQRLKSIYQHICRCANAFGLGWNSLTLRVCAVDPNLPLPSTEQSCCCCLVLKATLASSPIAPSALSVLGAQGRGDTSRRLRAALSFTVWPECASERVCWTFGGLGGDMARMDFRTSILNMMVAWAQIGPERVSEILF